MPTHSGNTLPHAHMTLVRHVGKTLSVLLIIRILSNIGGYVA